VEAPESITAEHCCVKLPLENQWCPIEELLEDAKWQRDIKFGGVKHSRGSL
jgi:hypothetical protein